MKLKIFGANLRDQSKGSFVVHAADCADCKKLEKIGEHFCVEEHDSVLGVSRSIWSDMINEGTMNALPVTMIPATRKPGRAKRKADRNKVHRDFADTQGRFTPNEG